MSLFYSSLERETCLASLFHSSLLERSYYVSSSLASLIYFILLTLFVYFSRLYLTASLCSSIFLYLCHTDTPDLLCLSILVRLVRHTRFVSLFARRITNMVTSLCINISLQSKNIINLSQKCKKGIPIGRKQGTQYETFFSCSQLSQKIEYFKSFYGPGYQPLAHLPFKY